MDITTKSQWDLLEKPLIEIDGELSLVAEKKNLIILQANGVFKISNKTCFNKKINAFIQRKK